MKLILTGLVGTALLLSGVAYGGGGPLGIDHEWSLDQNGIWARNYQTGLEYGVIALEVAGSLWLGNDDELGHTFWQTIDHRRSPESARRYSNAVLGARGHTRAIIRIYGSRAVAARAFRAAK